MFVHDALHLSERVEGEQFEQSLHFGVSPTNKVLVQVKR